MKDKTYTTRDVAAMLGVTVQTVQRWVDAGHLRGWRTAGGHRRLAVDSVEAFIRDAHLPLPLPKPEALAAASQDSPTPKKAPRDDSASQNRGPTVLVIDDDEGDRELAVHVVRSAMPQATVLEADNGFSGLIELGRHVVDILLTDIVMPHLDGVAMLKTVRTDPSLASVRIAAMSSHDWDEVARKGGLPEGVAFFQKPLRKELIQSFLLSEKIAGSAQ